MSYRGSFVTEYIYCDKCRDAVWSRAKEGYSVALPVHSIVSGYFYDMCDGEDVRILSDHMEQAELCPGHRVVLAILPECGRRHFLTLKGPRKSVRINILAQQEPLRHK